MPICRFLAEECQADVTATRNVSPNLFTNPVRRRTNESVLRFPACDVAGRLCLALFLRTACAVVPPCPLPLLCYPFHYAHARCSRSGRVDAAARGGDGRARRGHPLLRRGVRSGRLRRGAGPCLVLLAHTIGPFLVLAARSITVRSVACVAVVRFHSLLFGTTAAHVAVVLCCSAGRGHAAAHRVPRGQRESPSVSLLANSISPLLENSISPSLVVRRVIRPDHSVYLRAHSLLCVFDLQLQRADRGGQDADRVQSGPARRRLGTFSLLLSSLCVSKPVVAFVPAWLLWLSLLCCELGVRKPRYEVLPPLLLAAHCLASTCSHDAAQFAHFISCCGLPCDHRTATRPCTTRPSSAGWS